VDATSEVAALIAVGTTVLFDVSVATVVGVQAASAMTKTAITMLKIFFRYISFLQLYTVPHNNVNLTFRIWFTKPFKILLITGKAVKIKRSISARCCVPVKKI